jgi:hypothetical protein
MNEVELEKYKFTSYPGLLLSTLERATKLKYELTVKNGLFQVEDLRTESLWQMSPQYTEDSQTNLDALIQRLELSQEELTKLISDVEEKQRYRYYRKLAIILKKTEWPS